MLVAVSAVMTPLTSSTSTVYAVGLTSREKSPMELRTAADWVLKQRLLAVPASEEEPELVAEILADSASAWPDEEKVPPKAKPNLKPVVVVKLGASDAGRSAALAHTGRLAGSMAAFDAVAGAAGVIRVANLDAVVEAVEYLVHAPLPKGAGLGAITFSGGLRGMMLDAAAAQGLRFSPLADATRRQIESLVTVGTIVGNPLDAGFAALLAGTAPGLNERELGALVESAYVRHGGTTLIHYIGVTSMARHRSACPPSTRRRAR
jgi:hypothetical protein